MIQTCGHNFFKFVKDKEKKRFPVHCKPNDATFYLQRDAEGNWLLEMRVIDITVYPGYYNDKDFKNGTDFALALVEIPIDQY